MMSPSARVTKQQEYNYPHRAFLIGQGRHPLLRSRCNWLRLLFLFHDETYTKNPLTHLIHVTTAEVYSSSNFHVWGMLCWVMIIHVTISLEYSDGFGLCKRGDVNKSLIHGEFKYRSMTYKKTEDFPVCGITITVRISAKMSNNMN